jgi:cell division protein FtsX
MAFPLLGAFLATSIGALVKRALVAIGFGAITYTGLQVAFDSAKTSVIQAYGSMAGASLQLADLAGVGTVIGIILGAMAGRIAIVAVNKIGSVL